MENKVLKICENINDCFKIKMLRDHDWACDAQFADSVRKICARCKEIGKWEK